MISLKRYIESDQEQLLNAAIGSYQQVLKAIGDSGFRACPQVGGGMRESLLNLQQALAGHTTPRLLQETEQRVTAELDQWGSGTADYFKQRTTEVKELMVILAGAAEVAGERDQRYVKQFQDFTGRLQAIADLSDLLEIRDSLMKSAMELKSCAAAMADESQKAVAKLRQDVDTYQTRLDDAERLAGLDPLTGLDNRRKVEGDLEFRLSRGRPFSILLLDLNDFKKINDTYGHLAGDELLKKFAGELRSAFRVTDVIGRLGGDEFLVALDCDAQQAEEHRNRLAKWVFGDYVMESRGASRKISVTAAVGIAVSRPGDSLRTLLGRADEAMYREKRAGDLPACPSLGNR